LRLGKSPALELSDGKYVNESVILFLQTISSFIGIYIFCYFLFLKSLETHKKKSGSLIDGEYIINWVCNGKSMEWQSTNLKTIK
jgi:hypothetical protein